MYKSEKRLSESLKTIQSSSNSIHPDFLVGRDLIYLPNRFQCSEPKVEAESFEYGACSFELNGLSVRFRVAKITPTKIGQFVTVWKRVGDGPIQPFDISDPVDLFVISTRKGNHFGQFVFPKKVLCDQDIVSENEKGGKRGIRVYPPWDKTISPQAKKTQRWQLEYFLDASQGSVMSHERAKMLYRLG
jgi:hypothetical protein